MEEVEKILDEMERNQPNETLWDEFLSIPIKDKSLDEIRERTEVLWAYDEFMEKNKDGFFVLNDKGLNELHLIKKELRGEKCT